MFENDPSGLTGFMIGAVIFTVILFLIPFIFFLLTQQNTLKLVDPENRTMSPGQVWLQLIPVFNIVWQFIVVTRIAESVQKQLSATTFSFEENQNTSHAHMQEKPTYQIGIAYCVLFCLTWIPMIGVIFSIAGLVCWIIYWVKLAEVKNRLTAQKLESATVA